MNSDVVIVGAGPVGAVLALELARHGVPSLVVDRQVGPSRHPKMDYLNPRSMEHLDRLGLADSVIERGVDPSHPFRFVWARHVGGSVLSDWCAPSVTESLSMAANDGTATRRPFQRLQGSLLEEILRARLADHPLVDFRQGVDVVGAHQADDRAVAHVRVGDGPTSAVSARYLVGCDGAGSGVRKRAGITTSAIGPSTVQCDVYFRSNDVRLNLHGPAFLHVLASGLTLVSRNGSDTWTGSFTLPEGVDGLDDPVAEMVRLAGVDLEVDQVLNTTYWRGQLAVADRFRDRRVFLAGDSAHQFFPTGGYGANTGIEDAVNLGWKLAAMANGWGGERLLETYELERRPVALFNREMCFNLLDVWRRFPVLAAEGATDEQLSGFLAADRHQVSNVGVHFGARYGGSPLTVPDGSKAPPWQWGRLVPSTHPGHRVPSVRTAKGHEVFDMLGDGFTLVDLSGGTEGATVVEAAAIVGLPLDYLPIADSHLRRVWERNLVLVRPDQHVAWRGDTAPVDWAPILATAAGIDRSPAGVIAEPANTESVRLADPVST